MPGYDQSGTSYNLTRHADPEIVNKLIEFLRPKKDGVYLDLGCGTGNYTSALAKKGIEMIGVDPSVDMLAEAKEKDPSLEFLQGSSEDIPLQDKSVDGVVVTLSIHHWKDLEQGFREMNRVTKAGGRCVLFTSDKEQMRNYWLCHYFPNMMQESIDQMPSLKDVIDALQKANWIESTKEPFFIRPAHKDMFLYSGKSRPELYLKEEIRHGISSFRRLSNKEEIDHGLFRLEKDLKSGHFSAVHSAFSDILGDYAFVSAIQ